MTSSHLRISRSVCALAIAISCAGVAVAARPGPMGHSGAAIEGPADQGLALPQQRGDAIAGREVFRSETFGNEGFWTDAVRLPQGIASAKVTPLQALGLGLQIDADMVGAATKAQLGAELMADPTGKSSKLLNDPAVTLALYRTTLSDWADKAWRPLFDRLRTTHSSVIMCSAADMNGFLPTHVTEHSRAPIGELAHDTRYCRNGRILLDDVDKAAKSSSASFFMSVYRQEGDGTNYIVVRNVYTPVIVLGRRWGDLEVAYQIKK